MYLEADHGQPDNDTEARENDYYYEKLAAIDQDITNAYASLFVAARENEDVVEAISWSTYLRELAAERALFDPTSDDDDVRYAEFAAAYQEDTEAAF